MVVIKGKQLMALRLNKQLILEMISPCDAKRETNTRTLALKKAVTDNAREAAAAATAPGSRQRCYIRQINSTD